MTLNDIFMKQQYYTQWYEGLLGRSALDTLENVCAELMSEAFGYYAIQTGILSGKHDLLKASRIATTFSIANANVKHHQQQQAVPKKISVISSPEQLPVATDNVDLVVASHVLESSQDPHQVLREIDRVLVPEGHCILIGFNPLAHVKMGGLLSALKKDKDNRAPSMFRIKDWFSLLGFEVLESHYVGLRPNIKNKKLFAKMGWMENWGEFAGPALGKLYVLHVRKQVIAMRPHKKIWRAPAVLSGGKVVLNRTAQRVRRENLSEQ